MSVDKSRKGCRRCGKPVGAHRASDLACPMGKKQRTVGYTLFMRTSRLKLSAPTDGAPEATPKVRTP